MIYMSLSATIIWAAGMPWFKRRNQRKLQQQERENIELTQQREKVDVTQREGENEKQEWLEQATELTLGMRNKKKT